MILEISSNLVDRMHVEGALFHAISAENGLSGFDSLGGGVRINGDLITIKDTGSIFEVDLSAVPSEGEVVDRMETIIGQGRYFPDTYEDSIPLDNITPTKSERSIPNSADSLIETFYNWIRKCASVSIQEEIETGFYQDSLDNTVGVLEGDLESIEWPKSIVERHGMRFHTHPQKWYMADLSSKDLALLRDTEGNVAADAVASTFGVPGIVMVSYTMKKKDESADVEKEVSDYLSNMEEMGREEASIYLSLKDEGAIDFMEPWSGRGSVSQMVSNRIKDGRKKSILRDIVSDGYRLEESWEIMRY